MARWKSVDRLSALAGINQLAVEGADGWEVIQFASAELNRPVAMAAARSGPGDLAAA